jgi:hypothetical protein
VLFFLRHSLAQKKKPKTKRTTSPPPTTKNNKPPYRNKHQHQHGHLEVVRHDRLGVLHTAALRHHLRRAHLGVAQLVGARVDEQHRQEEEPQQLQRARDAVVDEVLHAREDGARDLDGRDDHAQTGLGQDHVGRGARGVGRALDSNADVGALERGGVVDAVARHAAREPFLAEGLDDQVLVLGEDAGEAVGLHDHAAVLGAQVLGDLAVLPQLGEAVRVGDVGAEAEHARGLLGDDGVVARDHLLVWLWLVL